MHETDQIVRTYTGSEPVRVDQRLAEEFPYSRNFFQHIIARGGVEVNDQVAKKATKLKAGDQVVVSSLERFLDGGVLAECPVIELDIRHERDDYLILYKPKGVLSHPNSIWDVSHPSVVGGLYHHYDQLPSTASFIRAGLIHRLDKETDGLMLIAKTERGLAHFKQLFQRKSAAATVDDKERVPLRKYYRAVCELSLLGETFIDKISFPHLIDEPVKPKVPHPGPPKRGLTKLLGETPQPPFGDGPYSGDTYLHLDIEILTGRTHQIRYHLSNHGLPIVGDYLYGRESDDQLQLTAWKLAVEDPDGEWVEVVI